MQASLNAAQLEILKMLQFEITNEELFELKKVISKYLADRLMRQVNEEVNKNGYSKEQIDNWANEHHRTTYKP